MGRAQPAPDNVPAAWCNRDRSEYGDRRRSAPCNETAVLGQVGMAAGYPLRRELDRRAEKGWGHWPFLGKPGVVFPPDIVVPAG
ncbi:hypothetical protein D3C81_2127270 [compost metagenome]